MPEFKMSKKKSAEVMRDLRAVLKSHGLPPRISELALAADSITCRCPPPDGPPGVIRHVSGVFVCDCSGING